MQHMETRSVVNITLYSRVLCEKSMLLRDIGAVKFYQKIFSIPTCRPSFSESNLCSGIKAKFRKEFQ